MAETRNRRRGLILFGIAAVAGVLAGTVAVYVRGLGNGNGGTAAGCDLALYRAKMQGRDRVEVAERDERKPAAPAGRLPLTRKVA